MHTRLIDFTKAKYIAQTISSARQEWKQFYRQGAHYVNEARRRTILEKLKGQSASVVTPAWNAAGSGGEHSGDVVNTTEAVVITATSSSSSSSSSMMDTTSSSMQVPECSSKNSSSSAAMPDLSLLMDVGADLWKSLEDMGGDIGNAGGDLGNLSAVEVHFDTTTPDTHTTNSSNSSTNNDDGSSTNNVNNSCSNSNNMSNSNTQLTTVSSNMTPAATPSGSIPAAIPPGSIPAAAPPGSIPPHTTALPSTPMAKKHLPSTPTTNKRLILSHEEREVFLRGRCPKAIVFSQHMWDLSVRQKYLYILWSSFFIILFDYYFCFNYLIVPDFRIMSIIFIEIIYSYTLYLLLFILI